MAKTKTILQKVNYNEKAEIYVPDKIPEKQLNEVEIGNLPEKEFRIIIVKMMQDLEKEWRQRRCKKYLPNTLCN